MKKIFVFAALLMSLNLQAQFVFRDSLKANELCGQSNSNGVDAAANFPANFRGVMPTVKLFYTDYQAQWNVLNAGVNSGNSAVGSDAIFGDSLSRFNGKTSLIVKTGKNGRGFLPTAGAADFNTANEEYVVTTTNELFNGHRLAYADSAKSLKIKVLVFIHGESDAVYKYGAFNYERNLTAFINKRKLDLRNPNLKVILVRLSSNSVYDYKPQVRQAQNNIAATMPNVYIVSNDDATFISDGIHYSASTTVKRGSDIYQILKNIF